MSREPLRWSLRSGDDAEDYVTSLLRPGLAALEHEEGVDGRGEGAEVGRAPKRHAVGTLSQPITVSEWMHNCSHRPTPK